MNYSRTGSRRSRRVALVPAILLALAFGIAEPAAGQAGDTTTASTTLTADEEGDARAFLAEHGVSADVQDALMAKLKAGELWDVFAGGNPVSTRTTTSPGMRRTIDTYADGSISVTSVEVPVRTLARPGVSPMYVANCSGGSTGTGYSTWTDCDAYSETGVVAIGFQISYTLTPGYDSIIRVDSPVASVNLGTLDPMPPHLTLVKKTENRSGSAWAKATATYNARGGGGSTSLELRALVGNNTAWTRWESSLG